MNKRKQLIITGLIFIAYTGLIIASNIFMKMSVSANNKTYEMISGILFGFIAIPIFSIIIPIWLSKKWQLDFSFWPKRKKIWIVLAILTIYILIANFESIKSIMHNQISIKDFIIHYISAMLFHVTYYPLFVLLILPIIRKYFGLKSGILFTSLLFALYHLAQFHFFPAGTTPLLQFFLFITFIVSLLFYLWSESLILVSLVHSTNGAIGLVANGTLFNEIDFLFYLTIIIVGSLFGYMIMQSFRKKDNYTENWWLKTKIE